MTENKPLQCFKGRRGKYVVILILVGQERYERRHSPWVTNPAKGICCITPGVGGIVILIGQHRAERFDGGVPSPV